MEYIIERELRETVQKHFPLDWKEDLLTHDLAIRFRKRFHRMTLHGTRFPIQVEWEIYKLHGKRETSYGDIGLLFRYELPAGGLIEGAGFIEAKLRARDSTRFRQVRTEQVARILARSPHTLLLLYDYNAVSVLDSSFVLEPDYKFFIHRWSHPIMTHARVTHGPVLPLQLAAAVNQYDDTLYRLCHSLSHQFSRRYFHLHDLDFSQQAIQAVKGFPANIGSPNILMIIRAAPEGRELPEPFRPRDDLYGGIE
jgi:hypothetical protein